MTFTWHVSPGHEHCQLCNQMNGYTWEVEIGTRPLPPTLDFIGMPVWDCNGDVSLAHLSSHLDYECFCFITAEPGDFSDLVQQIHDLVTAVVQLKALPGVSSP